MPNMVHEASHAAMRLVAADGPWASRLTPIAKTRQLIASFKEYCDWLRPLCAEINVWMTTYVHPLDGPGDIVDWFAGSALRPFLDPLDEAEQPAFSRPLPTRVEIRLPRAKGWQDFPHLSAPVSRRRSALTWSVGVHADAAIPEVIRPYVERRAARRAASAAAIAAQALAKPPRADLASPRPLVGGGHF